MASNCLIWNITADKTVGSINEQLVNKNLNYKHMKTLQLLLALLALIFIVNCSSSKQMTLDSGDYKLETIEFDAKDDNIKGLLLKHENETKFKKGQSLKESTFHKERKRIVKLIRKNNDPHFSIDNISFEIDTTLSKHKYSVKTIVLK